MPRLLDYLSPLYNALLALNPEAPKAAFVALIFSLVLLWRKLSPESWKAYSALVARLVGITEADTNGFKEFALKVGQALPSALMGAVIAGLGTADFWVSFKLSMLSFLAPIGHEFMANYKGKLGKSKEPPGGDSKPVAATPHVFLQNEDGSPIEMRSWRHPFWRLALPLVLLVSACGASGWEAQRTAANTIGHVVNDSAEPAIVAAYRATGRAAIEQAPTQEDAEHALSVHHERWKPLLAAFVAFKEAHTAWQAAIDAKGDPVPSAIAAREAYCRARKLALDFAVELPQLPLMECK
jgi:hypothetical protein